MCAKKAVQSAEYNLDFDRFITEIFYNNKKKSYFQSRKYYSAISFKIFFKNFSSIQDNNDDY